MKRGRIVVKLAEVAEINPRLASGLADDAEVAFVPMSAVSSETARVESSEVRRYEQVRRGYTPFLRDDVLVAKITPCFENGKIARAEIAHPVGFGSTEFHVVRPLDGKLDGRYLLHLLRQDNVRRAGKRRMTGSGGQRRVPAAFLGELEMPLLSVEEQRRIAEVLDRAEALRAKRRTTLRKLDALAWAIFTDMFGDTRCNSKQWPYVELGRVVANEDARRVPVKASDRAACAGQFPYYGASGVIDRIDDFIFDGERLLVAEDGANLVARTTPVAFLASGRFWVNNHAHVLAENGRADLRYLEFFVEQTDLTPYLSGTAQPKLNRANLDRIPVPLPPLPLQRGFRHRVEALAVTRAAQRSSLAALDSLFASLQHRAFCGGL